MGNKYSCTPWSIIYDVGFIDEYFDSSTNAVHLTPARLSLNDQEK